MATLPNPQNAQVAYSYLLAKGLSPAQAAGIVGNMALESGINPESKNSIGCIGLVQWCFGRGPASLQTGNATADMQSQLDYLWHELSTNYAGSLQAVKATSTPQDAAAVFEHTYEISGGVAVPQRQSYAAQVLAMATSGNWLANPNVTAGSDAQLAGITDIPKQIAGFTLNPLGVLSFLPFHIGSSVDLFQQIGSVINHVVSAVTSPNFWIRVGEFLLGGMLIILGTSFLLSESKTAKSAAGTAVVAAAA